MDPRGIVGVLTEPEAGAFALLFLILICSVAFSQ